ncbi:MAG: hypothetical protein II921_04300 [Treponema sp.]|nr:hypothetical protein [Treponema sp.]
MGDIFETEYEEKEDISQFDDYSDDSEKSDEGFVCPKNLYSAKLEYSCEGVYVTAPDKLGKLNPGDGVIIPTRYGNDLAFILGKPTAPVGIKSGDIIAIDRRASHDDLALYQEHLEQEKDAFDIFREKVAVHALDMKLITVHFLIDEPKALFFFSSENRVDFRELVKDLVSVFKMRIELRQIGVRDESRITGGLGVCGRPYCCHTISDKLPSVSIKMAKEQNLSLNSTKISGQCGRLLCCLSYEYNWYAEAKKNLPNEGIHLFYDGTNFKITDVNPLTQMLKMLGEDGRLLEIPAKRFQKEGNRWKII